MNTSGHESQNDARRGFRRLFHVGRYEFDRKGKRFILWVAAFQVAVALAYLGARWLFPPEDTTYAALDFVDINRFGQVTIKSAEDIDWYIGADKAVPLLTAIGARNQQIAELRGRVRTQLSDLNSRLGNGFAEELQPVLAALESGEPVKLPRMQRSIDAPGRKARLRRLLRGYTTGDDSPSSVPAFSADIRALSTNLAAIRERFEKIHTANGAWLEWRDRVQDRAQDELRWLERFAGDAESALANATNAAIRKIFGESQEAATRIRALRSTLSTPTNFPAPTAADEIVSKLDASVSEMALVFQRDFRPAHRASFLFSSFVSRHEGRPLEAAGRTLLNDIESSLLRLDALREEQVQSVLSLRQPQKYQLFWSSSFGVLWEILFWAMFGVTTNLLFSSGEWLRRDCVGAFRPIERWVGFTKIIYGPAVALALCLALIVGLVHVMGEEVRIWTMPILGFLFGFNARKTAQLVDRLSQKVLGKVGESMEVTQEQRVKQADAARQKILAAIPPLATLSDFKEEAGKRIDVVVKSIVSRNESKI